jgi:hypothetical protein
VLGSGHRAPGLLDERSELLALEGDGRALRVVLVVEVGALGRGHDLGAGGRQRRQLRPRVVEGVRQGVHATANRCEVRHLPAAPRPPCVIM